MRFKEKLVWDSENQIRFDEKKCYKCKKFLLNALVFFVHRLLKVWQFTRVKKSIFKWDYAVK